MPRFRRRPDRPASPRLSRAAAALPHLINGALVAAILWLAMNRNALYESLSGEDGWVEWATFLAFAVAGAMALFRLRGVKRSGWQTATLVGLGLFCLFVAGEEISWGERLIGYRPAAIFLEKNYQQEANLHNLLDQRMGTRWFVLAIALVYGILAPLLLGRSRRLRPLLPAIRLVPSWGLVVFLEWAYPFYYTGELAEMLLGVSFALDIAERRLREGRLGAWMAPAMQLAVLAGAVVLVPLGDRIASRGADRLVPVARDQLRELRAGILSEGVLRPDLLALRRVHKRLYGANEKYLSMPGSSFYLDPWNQPYWFTYERVGLDGRILLYSFGPNRRRDSDPFLLAEPEIPVDTLLGGDDLGVLIVLEDLIIPEGESEGS